MTGSQSVPHADMYAVIFWEKKKQAIWRRNTYKLVIISWSIHNHISCDWTISVCSVYTNKIGTKTTGFEYKVRVACQSNVCHMPNHDTPHIHILKENVNYWLGRNTSIFPTFERFQEKVTLSW